MAVTVRKVIRIELASASRKPSHSTVPTARMAAVQFPHCGSLGKALMAPTSTVAAPALLGVSSDTTSIHQRGNSISAAPPASSARVRKLRSAAAHFAIPS